MDTHAAVLPLPDRTRGGVAACLRALALLAVLVGGVAGAGARAADEPAQTVVDGFHEALMSAMKNARTLGSQGRFKLLEPVMMRAFDMPGMTETAAGEGWGRLTPPQREKLIAAFARFEIAQYADWFDGYSNQTFSPTGVRTVPAGAVVGSAMTTDAGRRQIRFDYNLRKTADGWKIIDVVFNGWFSEMTRRHAEFTEVLDHQGVDTLIARLQAGAQASLKRPDNLDAPHVIDPRPEMWRIPRGFL
jgi:phospholipid transport system substrate-binding protein